MPDPFTSVEFAEGECVNWHRLTGAQPIDEMLIFGAKATELSKGALLHCLAALSAEKNRDDLRHSLAQVREMNRLAGV